MKNGLKKKWLWISFYFSWCLILSGSLKSFGLQAPGLWQVMQLQNLIDQKKSELEGIEQKIVRLEQNSTNLEKSMLHQEREAREVLGYLQENEVVFDFSAHSPYRPEGSLSNKPFDKTAVALHNFN